MHKNQAPTRSVSTFEVAILNQQSLIDRGAFGCHPSGMGWLGYIGFSCLLLIGAWIYYAHPGSSVVPEQQLVQGVKSVEGAKPVCLASANNAYRTDLVIALDDCPKQADGFPDPSCVKKTPDGAQAYAKYESAVAACGN